MDPTIRLQKCLALEWVRIKRHHPRLRDIGTGILVTLRPSPGESEEYYGVYLGLCLDLRRHGGIGEQKETYCTSRMMCGLYSRRSFQIFCVTVRLGSATEQTGYRGAVTPQF